MLCPICWQASLLPTSLEIESLDRCQVFVLKASIYTTSSEGYLPMFGPPTRLVDRERRHAVSRRQLRSTSRICFVPKTTLVSKTLAGR